MACVRLIIRFPHAVPLRKVPFQIGIFVFRDFLGAAPPVLFVGVQKYAKTIHARILQNHVCAPADDNAGLLRERQNNLLLRVENIIGRTLVGNRIQKVCNKAARSAELFAFL